MSRLKEIPFQKEYDPTTLHVNKRKEWATKQTSRNEISKEWAKYIVDENAVTEKDSTLYKTHKPIKRVHLLRTGCNTAIDNYCVLQRQSLPHLLIILKQG